jgi:hypothetical protein
MRPMGLVLAVVVLSDLRQVEAQAVEQVPPRKEAVVSGVLMVPHGDFRRALGTVGYGGGFHGGVAIGSSPVSVGVDSHLLFYELRSRRDHEMILTAHGLLRLIRRTPSRRPYAEALVGIKGFSIEPTRIGTTSYGVGGGMQLPLKRRDSAGGRDEQFVEIGVRYTRGGGARVDYERFTSTSRSVMVYVGSGRRY